MRHAASIFLLLGWSAFLLVATLQPCCNFSVAAPHTVSAETASHSAAFDHHGDADHHSPDSSSTCHDITIVSSTGPTTAAHSIGSEDTTHAYAASVFQEGYAVRRTPYAIEYPPIPPPRTLPFYLRTSRILI